jgi:hypothetical protein
MTLAIPWERLEAGPAGEYIEVLDIDEHGKRVHPPVRLDDPRCWLGRPAGLRRQSAVPPADGLRGGDAHHPAISSAPSAGAHWPPRVDPKDGTIAYQAQLRMCPHYFMMANAHYLPEKGLFCFGYFRSQPDSPFPGTTIFTCLSQDVIAHELSHALLLGMNVERPIDGGPDVGRDTFAFHEAFCDLIALLQHFGRSDVLLAQLADIRGSLDEQSALGAVALQFGQALGNPDGIRNALGKTIDGQWRPRKPDPRLYQTIEEPHERGDVLVAAVFDAFKKIYESRVADLRRIATRGTGVLAAGSLHPDLVNRFADEAARAAQRVLEMCLRAVDYLPPVEVTFGDYRAIVTADYDLGSRRSAPLPRGVPAGIPELGRVPSGGRDPRSTRCCGAPPSGEVGIVSEFVRSPRIACRCGTCRASEALTILQTLPRRAHANELRMHANKKEDQPTVRRLIAPRGEDLT